MKYYTQSNLSPGNCWQTAVACLLEVEPDLLPPQHEIESLDHAILNGYGSYQNVLNGYLGKHHGLIYVNVHEWMFGSVKPVIPVHVMCGPTVRTAALQAAGAPNIHHCVVGLNGVMVWDVHPSRTGLIGVREWGLLGELQPCTIADRKKWTDNEMADLVFNRCLCPACNLSKLRELHAKFEAEKEGKGVMPISR